MEAFLSAVLEYLGALFLRWWSVFGVFGTLAGYYIDFLRRRRADEGHPEVPGRYTLIALIATLVVAQALAWFDMRKERNSLIKTGPELSMSVRWHHRDKNQIDVFVRNDGDETSVIQEFYVCDSRDWLLSPTDDFEKPSIVPEDLDAIETEEHRRLLSATVRSDSELRLWCRDMTKGKRLSIEVLSGTLAVGPGEVTELRLGGVPKWWYIHQDLFANPVFTACPVQLNADNAKALIAPSCGVRKP